MSALGSLKQAATLHDVADLLGFTPAAVAYLTRYLPPEVKYRTFDIPKRSGGTRTISAPVDQLMLLQRKLCDILQDCAAEIGSSEKWLDQMSHGFVRDRSIVTNARKHRGKRFVFNVDIDNFFGTINFGRVRGFFIKNKHFQLADEVATVLAQIACHKNALPQGSPCSPVISNLIGQIIDVYLCRLAISGGCTYSRYVDDITFSTNKRAFPASIAEQDPSAPNIWRPGPGLLGAMKHADFALNAQKTRMQYADSRQEVTGLVVNSRINARLEYRHTVRAMAHRLFETGKFDFFDANIKGPGSGTLPQLHGSLGFIDEIDKDQRRALAESGRQNGVKPQPSARESIYRRFLLYRFFHAAETPLIICEGKTDSVYLRCAIKSLYKNYPTLAEIKDGTLSNLKVSFFKYRESSTTRILQLHGGTGHFKEFVLWYAKEIVRIKAPGQQTPVILLVDNDDGCSKLVSVVTQISGTKPDAAQAFHKICANLYLVLTPPIPGVKQSMIENFFSTSVLEEKVGGKTFDPSISYDSAANYGKHVFAQQVVAKKASSIDFSGFTELLNRLVAVIDHHKGKK
jgi:RNA-directed DNA polymerase